MLCQDWNPFWWTEGQGGFGRCYVVGTTDCKSYELKSPKFLFRAFGCRSFYRPSLATRQYILGVQQPKVISAHSDSGRAGAPENCFTATQVALVNTTYQLIMKNLKLSGTKRGSILQVVFFAFASDTTVSMKNDNQPSLSVVHGLFQYWTTAVGC